jgi:tetratricopeptide (TPR) repeat protein
MPQPTDPRPRHHESIREHGAVVVPIAAAAERRRRNKALEDFRHLEDLTEAMADEPDGHAKFTFLGNLRFIAGEYEDAIRSYSRALSLAPDDLSARAGRARARSEIFDLDLALADFDWALELAPDDAKLHYGRGHCLSRLIEARRERDVDDSETDEERRIRCEDALASLEKAAELGLDTPVLYYELVSVREQMGDPDAIMAMLDRATAAVPDEIPLLAMRCARRRSKGDTAGAEADRVRLLELGFDVTQP